MFVRELANLVCERESMVTVTVCVREIMLTVTVCVREREC